MKETVIDELAAEPQKRKSALKHKPSAAGHKLAISLISIENLPQDTYQSLTLVVGACGLVRPPRQYFDRIPGNNNHLILQQTRR